MRILSFLIAAFLFVSSVVAAQGTWNTWEFSLDRNQRNTANNIFGGLKKVNDADTISTSDSPIATVGLAQILLVLNAGSDYDGAITITGTSVDSFSGAVVTSDTEVLTIDELSVDGSSTSTVGTDVWDIVNGYASEKLWKGQVTLSTAASSAVSLTDFDVYSMSVLDPAPVDHIYLQNFQMSSYVTNTAGFVEVSLNVVDRDADTKKVTISQQGNLAVSAADSIVGQYVLRTQLTDAPIRLDIADRDGFFVDAFFGPDSQTYWTAISLRVVGRLYDTP